jgi:hypothetical protein
MSLYTLRPTETCFLSHISAIDWRLGGWLTSLAVEFPENKLAFQEGVS